MEVLCDISISLPTFGSLACLPCLYGPKNNRNREHTGRTKCHDAVGDDNTMERDHAVGHVDTQL